MNLELVLQRLHHHRAQTRTPGEVRANGLFFCYSCEDPVREIAGQPVRDWKIDGETAIPAGRYAVTLDTSPRFGPDTITVHNVAGFSAIRIHSGNDEMATEGCPLVGYELTAEGAIAFGQTKAAAANLKRAIREVIAGGGKVFIDVRNPS